MKHRIKNSMHFGRLHDLLIGQVGVVGIVGSHFTTGLRSRTFGCKSNRRKMSTI
jgi:hypothetical protein